MKIAVVGTGYVGLVTGTCFAESGNDVVCVDIDEQKIARLAQGSVPIYEPGLAEMVSRNLTQGRLRFTTDLDSAVKQSLIIFIAVGTPSAADGSTDLGSVRCGHPQLPLGTAHSGPLDSTWPHPRHRDGRAVPRPDRSGAHAVARGAALIRAEALSRL